MSANTTLTLFESGLGKLLFWETYVAWLEYAVLSTAPSFIAIFLIERWRGTAGILFPVSVLLVAFSEAAAIVVFVLSLAPIILGLSGDAAWLLPWEFIASAPASFLGLIGVLLLVQIALVFVPVLGWLPTCRMLIVGAIVLLLAANLSGSADSIVVAQSVEVIPNVWLSLGILVLCIIMTAVALTISALLAAAFCRIGSEFCVLFLRPVADLFYFVPLFVWGAWLGAQI